MNERIIKTTIFLMMSAVLGLTTLFHPGNIALAQTQGNLTGNMTIAIDVDTLSNNIKERHPVLAQFSGDEDGDIVEKIKVMDSKEAAKSTIALNILRLLQQYKQLD